MHSAFEPKSGNKYPKSVVSKDGGLWQTPTGCPETVQLEDREHADFWKLRRETDAYESFHKPYLQQKLQIAVGQV